MSVLLSELFWNLLINFKNYFSPPDYVCLLWEICRIQKKPKEENKSRTASSGEVLLTFYHVCC